MKFEVWIDKLETWAALFALGPVSTTRGQP